jgi:hypothetical protein
MSVVINYYSNDYCFLDAMLTQCMKFTDDIVVSYGSHFYDGTPESEGHYAILRATYPTVRFVQYAVDVAQPSATMKGVQSRRTAYWCNLARWTGVQALARREWVFFLDVDEIPEGDRVKEFLDHVLLRPDTSYKLSNYWYFKAPIHQATAYEDSIVLIHGSHLTEEAIFGDGERDHIVGSTPTCKRSVPGMNGKPLFHHYSWVRSRAGLRQKLTSWSHSSDYPNHEELVNQVFVDDDVHDIVHRYTYRQVPNYFRIDLDIPIPTKHMDSDVQCEHGSNTLEDSSQSSVPDVQA